VNMQKGLIMSLYEMVNEIYDKIVVDPQPKVEWVDICLLTLPKRLMKRI
jgi:hypothetical protein